VPGVRPRSLQGTRLSDVTYTTQRPRPEGDGGRLLQRRRPLPGGRAVVGGFLVALAAVGIFAAYTDATAGDRRQYLVARADLPMGHRISRGDVSLETMDLPPSVQRQAVRDPARLVGATVIGPVVKGELIQASDFTSRDGQETGLGPEISFPVESARALSGQLRVGELVDVLATYDSGGQDNTVFVVRNARVMNRSKPGGALNEGADGKEVITLAVSSPTETLALAHAASAGTITIVRSAGPAASPAESSYQTPPSGSTTG
jgi:Flp pilus assembly protein CpaB